MQVLRRAVGNGKGGYIQKSVGLLNAGVEVWQMFRVLRHREAAFANDVVDLLLQSHLNVRERSKQEDHGLQGGARGLRPGLVDGPSELAGRWFKCKPESSSFLPWAGIPHLLPRQAMGRLITNHVAHKEVVLARLHARAAVVEQAEVQRRPHVANLARAGDPRGHPLRNPLEEREDVDGRGGAGLEVRDPVIEDLDDGEGGGGFDARGAPAVEDGEDEGVAVAGDVVEEALGGPR